MSRRVLVACVGNVFLGDDGFGIEVARRLASERLPEGVKVVDFGIRGMHLTMELLAPPELLVLVDATSRRGPAGTLYVIDPERTAEPPPLPIADAHAMDPRAVLAAVQRLVGSLPKTRIVGCEPANLSEGMGLSDPVQRAVEPAVAMIRRLIESEVIL
jgi:hydrogenase maturation protease